MSGSPLTALRRLRRRITTPSLREVDPDHRGFYPWVQGESIVPQVGRAFLAGFATGMQEKDAVTGVRVLAQQPDQWRGFAVEGAGMALAIRAAMEPWSRLEFHRLLTACGDRHPYMIYVGLGWALARIPRPAWPDLERFDPLLVPLVLDGYGFHQFFFATEKVLAETGVDFPVAAWPGRAEDVPQNLAQGIGRAMWFVVGGCELRATELIATFDPAVHGSLWAGLGLAASYAGGRDEAGLQALAKAADEHLPWLRQGSAFAVEARYRAGTVVAHTQIAARAICGLEVASVLEMVDRTRPAGRTVDAGEWGGYEQWRARTAQALRP